MHASVTNQGIQARIPTATLPTGPFLAAIFGIGAAVALAWWAVTWLLGLSPERQLMGLVAVGVVAGCATVALLIVRPWRRRSMMSLPFVWLGSSALRMVAVLAVSILLYFAFSLDAASLLIAVVVAYLATLLGETLIYVRHVRVLPPLQGSHPEGDG